MCNEAKEVIRLDRKLKYQANIFNLYEDTVIANGYREKYDFIHHDGAAAVLAVCEDERIMMVRQYRNALNRFTLELPAGKRDRSDEPTIETAKRELEEETGFASDDLEYLMSINTTVAFCDEKIDIYIARNLKKTKPHPDRDEAIEVRSYELNELESMIFQGKLTDAKTVAAILGYVQKK